MRIEITTQSPEETLEVGRRIGGALGLRAVVLLAGEMGAGKTVLTKGIFAGRGGDHDEVVSPSYTLVNVYDAGGVPFHHVDLYRLEDPRHVLGLEYEEFLYHEEGVTVIEWPRTIGELLDEGEAVAVTIEERGDSGRAIVVEGDESLHPDLFEELARC